MGAFASCIALNLFECFACMACSCCQRMFNYSLSQAARLSHILIIVSVFSLAIILGQSFTDKFAGNYYVETYTTIDITQGCDPNNMKECIYRQLIYRASFALAITFSIMAILGTVSDSVNRKYWVLKFLIANGIFIGFFWSENSLFEVWAEITRVLSLFWLQAQSLLILDVAHDMHDIIIRNADAEEVKTGDSRGWYALYLFIALAGLSCSGGKITYRYILYQ